MQKLKIVSIYDIPNSWKTNSVVPHSMHHLCSRICSFPPSMPDYFIKKYSKEGDVVFDPWSGKGTVPFQALLNGRIGIGNDKSPEAFILTHAKTNPISFSSLEKYIVKIEKKMNKIKIPKTLNELDKKASIFYSKKTFEQILKLKIILAQENSNKAIVTKAIILGLLHGNTINSFSLRCSHSYAMSPNYVKKYAKEHKLRRPSKNVITCIINRGQTILKESFPKIKGITMQNDSTKINLKSKSVDMVLTSPPYFDVQTYAWANWLRLWFLGYNYKEIKQKLSETGSEVVYREFMRKSIFELFRILRHKSHCFIVVGDVRIGRQKKFINTAEFLLPLCLEAGFKLDKIIKDEIPNKRRVHTYLKEGEGIKTERILLLKKD
jgi:hypothetical protein